YLVFPSLCASGDSVTQTEGVVTLPEKASLTLKCTYQSSYSGFLFWYVQYRNKELELLLKSSLGNQKVTSRGFEATHISSDSSFHLQKSSMQTSDSAVYNCALSDTVELLSAPLGTRLSGRTVGDTEGVKRDMFYFQAVREMWPRH
uniref:Ig-like domain-containing protein n=1 Tax=Bos taurus TaxID=9913 RepID=G3N0J5_BOVIN